jgi:hypothetical protein
LKLKHDKLLSNFAFKSNLRRYSVGLDATEIREDLAIIERRFQGDCHLLPAFPGVTTIYGYNYKVHEDVYRVLALPLDAAEREMASWLLPNGQHWCSPRDWTALQLDSTKPEDPRVQLMEAALDSVLAVQDYLEGDIKELFAAKSAEAKGKLYAKKNDYDKKNAESGKSEYTSRQKQQIHYLQLACERSCSLSERVANFKVELWKLTILKPKNVNVNLFRGLMKTALGLLEDVFFIQRRAASKLLTIRLNDSSMNTSTCVARVTHAGYGRGLED